MRAALAPWLQGKLMGRNDFEGFRTRARLRAAREGSRARAAGRASAAARDRGSAARAALPAVGVPRDPGASGRDAAGLALRRRRLPRAAPAADARRLRDLGARRVHGGERRHAADPAQPSLGRRRAAAERREDAVSICMPAGSVVVFAGHAPAPRRREPRRRYTPRCHPAVLPALAAPAREHGARGAADAARRLSPRVQELLGYSIAEPSFMGYVDGLHPKRLIDPDYAEEESDAPTESAGASPPTHRIGRGRAQ